MSLLFQSLRSRERGRERKREREPPPGRNMEEFTEKDVHTARQTLQKHLLTVVRQSLGEETV